MSPKLTTHEKIIAGVLAGAIATSLGCIGLTVAAESTAHDATGALKQLRGVNYTRCLQRQAIDLGNQRSLEAHIQADRILVSTATNSAFRVALRAELAVDEQVVSHLVVGDCAQFAAPADTASG